MRRKSPRGRPGGGFAGDHVSSEALERERKLQWRG